LEIFSKYGPAVQAYSDLLDGAVLASDNAFMLACAMSDETAVSSSTLKRQKTNTETA
jgi:hypothetical protein